MVERLKQIDILRDKLNSLRPLTTGELSRLKEEFIIEYTYDSNAIEGSTLTLEETALVLKEGITISEKPLSHHMDAIGHKDAYFYIEDLVKNKIALTEREILSIHTFVLMDKPNDKGKYRNVPVKIVGSDIALPQPYLINPKMEELMLWYNSNKDHPIRAIADFHLRFETIHPFIDGNGRTGRLILNMELMKNGYVPINIKYKDKRKYYDCFKSYHQTGNYDKLVELICDNLEEELNRYIELRN